ncbi:Xaa-Pro peptidase family protein [Desulfococcaceae bacterium HSG7]|nr:Xaa-Pro peptidase family protein [Desulfococcaceae bacterium HSG7]
MHHYKNRLIQFRKLLAKKQFDVFLVLIEENRRYLSGFTGEDNSFDESAGALLISASHAVLATDSRFELQAGNETLKQEFKIVKYEKGLEKALPDILTAMHCKRLGFESTRLSYKAYLKIAEKLKSDGLEVELIPCETLVENLRITKDEDEIMATRKALVLAETVFTDVIKTLKPGMTEKETAWAMDKGMREAGADCVSFPTICASGLNSALPHAIPTNRRLQADEPILFDWGARLNGYCSDTTRTIVLGTPDKLFTKVYSTVRDAQRFAIDAIRPGVTGKAVDAVARNHIHSNGFKDKFGHGLGHGTGLAVHEGPRLSRLYDKPLDTGMIITVEPGVYLPDWGGVRIENQVVVREDGAEVLNTLDTALISSS